MARPLKLILGCTLLVFGWLIAFSMPRLPLTSELYWIVPTLSLGLGLGLLVRTARWPLTVFTAILTGMLALYALQTWPIDRWLATIVSYAEVESSAKRFQTDVGNRLKFHGLWLSPADWHPSSSREEQLFNHPYQNKGGEVQTGRGRLSRSFPCPATVLKQRNPNP